LPAADLPIVHTLQLSPLYLITDSRRYGKNGMLVLIERALQLSIEEYTEYARIDTARAMGAQGLAMIQGLWEASSVEMAVEAVLR
jgi:hypothetical protein